MNIRTASDLKFAVEQAGNAPKFFTRGNMKFLGDTMKNYAVRQPREIETHDGSVMAYELARKKPVKHGVNASVFFEINTFRKVYPK